MTCTGFGVNTPYGCIYGTAENCNWKPATLKAELAQQATNSDYTAALEQAIFDFAIKENKVCTIDFRKKLATHLNSVVKAK
jgi:hypothetical protein